MRTHLAAACLLTFLALAGCASDEAPHAAATTAPLPTSPPAPLALSLEPPAPTVAGVVTITGTVARPTEAVVTISQPGARDPDTTLELQLAPEFSIDVPLKHIGQNIVVVQPANAREGLPASTTAVRLGTYTLQVDYAGYPGMTNSEDVVLMDPDAPASLPMYQAEGATHAPGAVVHDLLVAWQIQTGNEVEYGYSAELNGFSVNRINGAGNPVETSLPPWWCFKLDGERGSLGISLQEVEPGDVVSWDLGACA